MAIQIDVAAELAAVTRSVGAGERDGASVRVITLRRSYPAPPTEVWDALTSAERIPHWFLPISGDLRPGGRYQFEGNAGGEILGCRPPAHLSVTWEFGGEVSWVDVRLHEEEDGGTTLEMEHVAAVPPAMWDEYGPGAVGIGWEHGLMGLALHLSSGRRADPAEAMAWLGSHDGKAHITGSSEAWGRASIAGGTEEGAATAAAARTTAAYTGAG